MYLKLLRATYLIMHFSNALKTSPYHLSIHPKMTKVNGKLDGAFFMALISSDKNTVPIHSKNESSFF